MNTVTFELNESENKTTYCMFKEALYGEKPLVLFTDSSPLFCLDTERPLVKIEVTELINKWLRYSCVMVLMESKTCSVSQTFMGTHSNGDCTCHCSEVSLNKFGNWSWLTAEKKWDKNVKARSSAGDNCLYKQCSMCRTGSWSLYCR